MKKIVISLIASFLLTALQIEAWSGETAFGFTVPKGVPAKLPIGSLEESLAWIVSRSNDLPGINFYMNLMYTNSINKRCEPGRFGSIGGGLNSLEEYLNLTAVTGLELLEEVRTNIYAPTSPIYFFTSVDFHPPPNGYVSAFFSPTPLGTIPQITSNSFRVITLPHVYRIPVHVVGLQEFRVEVGRPIEYSYTWNTQKGSHYTNWPGIKQECTQKDYVVLSSPYCQGTNVVRFHITVKDQTYTYTQFGELIAPPVLKIDRRGNLSVAAARGADVTVETSTNGVDWVPAPRVRRLVVVPREPQRFYRAFAN
ncbi:MAG: hypothetical protein WC648_00165 [Candidatus Paceibacterota bacterium]|jgi:hypothetical protein